MIEIDFPLRVLAGFASEDGIRAAANAASTRIREMQLNVLIVDDDDVFRAEFKRMLKRRYEVTGAEAADVFTAVEMLSERPYDLVLLDFWLDQLTGDEAYLLIRKTTGFRRVALMSTDVGVRQTAADLELDFYGKMNDDEALERILLGCEKEAPE